MTAAATFTVLPAIDVLGTEAVRLLRGDYDEVTLREPDPFRLIERFVAAGADLVHLVDLGAARAGGVRPELVRRAVEAAGRASVQAAGGIRTLPDAEALLETGAARVVVGTAAFTRGEALGVLVAMLGERLVVAIDVREGVVAVDGWTRSTSLSVGEAVERCAEAGVSRLLCTAIERDGTLRGPSLELLADVSARFHGPVIAAGGVRSVDDLVAIEAAGCEGAIVGRALLEGLVPLSALGSRGRRVESAA